MGTKPQKFKPIPRWPVLRDVSMINCWQSALRTMLGVPLPVAPIKRHSATSSRQLAIVAMNPGDDDLHLALQ